MNSDPTATAPSEDEFVYVFPATHAQRRFWLLDRLHAGGNSALNLAVPLRLRGPLDLPVLQRALDAVVARHEALRTTFLSERGDLRQLIAPSATVALQVDDARNVPATEHAEVIARAMREEAHYQFDLEAGPLLRVRLVQLAATDHLLLLTVHHIISDGWSNGVLSRELWTCYTAFLRHEEPALPKLRIQFADYADWQHERLEANDFDWQREYWRQQLSGDLPVLDLPTDRPRLKARNAAGDLRSRIFPPELVSAAKALATREGGSPFMLFLAVFQVLLHRYTGQHDFLITTPSANRERQEFEPLIGQFVNLLLLRADLRDDPPFTELLARVRRVALDGLVNQDVPFELLLDEFQPSRLQVNFLYQPAFFESATLPGGLSVEPLTPVSAGTVYELSALVLEDAHSVRLELEYDTALFDAETIERMLGHYETLLESVLADPAQNISALPLLTAAERRQFGLAISSPAAPRAALDIRGPLLARVVEKTDSMIARHGKRELSCAELLARMESARNSDRNARQPSDLDQGAAWVAHWRARLETPPPPVIARSPEADGVLAEACAALRDCMAVQPDERVASFSRPGSAATEELGAAALAGVLLVYPTPELLGESPPTIVAWLERENISIACMPAALWNRLAISFGRKLARPPKLRLVLATEGGPREGTFGHVSRSDRNNVSAGPRVISRTVIEAAGGTIALDRRPLSAAARLRVLDPHSHEPLPIGIPGDLAFAENGIGTPVGELARWLPDGSVERMGPSAVQHFARGFRVDLRRMEAALCSLSGVRHALLRPVAAANGAGFVAYLLPESGGSLPPDATLRQMLREKNLPDQAVPAAFLRLKDIPVRLVDGRLDLEALPRRPPAP